jgi:phosphoheptose isomerase
MTKPMIHFNEYLTAINDAMKSFDHNELHSIINAIRTIQSNDNRIFSCGNGGSAAIANHLVCDCMKGVGEDAKVRLDVLSLCSNVPLITAISNDIGYDEVFSKQLEYQARKSDMLIAISSSGNSPNIISAIKKANDMGLITVAITGFDGGESAKLANFSIHIKSDNYGVVEDVSQSVMHFIAQNLRRHLSDKPADQIKY